MRESEYPVVDRNPETTPSEPLGREALDRDLRLGPRG
jgi:hypothetical protein